MEALSIKEIAEAVGGKILCGDENKMITAVSTNSKNVDAGALFVPIVGERVDAHDFIEDAFANGAAACFTSRNKVMNSVHAQSKIHIAVEDTLKALQLLGSFYRSRFNIPVIGITGSVGKTTTKEMVAAALETKYNVLKTEGNMNSQVGLPLMMLRIESKHDIAVIEMGMSEEGEMEKLTQVAKPEVAIMTNIGVSHIGQLKTRENIRKEKLNIINSFDSDSILYINGNDELLSEVYVASHELSKASIKDSNENITNIKKTHNTDKIDMCDATHQKFLNTKVVSFGTEEFCEYKAENIQTIAGETHFVLRTADSTDDKEEIVLGVLGLHNVYNALAALAVAKHYNIPASTAKEGLHLYQPIAMRGQIKEMNQVKIIDDSYNASPDSMKSGIQVLLSLEGVTRRIAVLADVLELGEQSYQCHYDVGNYIAEQKIDELITIGTEASYIAKAIHDKNSNILTHSYDNNEEAIAYLRNNLKPGDAVLVKGSRGMKTDVIVKAISE